MTTTYTQTYRFGKPDFRSPDWAPTLQATLDAIDKAIRNANADIVAWANATVFEIGNIAIDTVDSPASFWICAVDHTSAVAPTTFAQDRVANPTYWSPYSFGLVPRGAWSNNTSYQVNDIAYDSSRGLTGIVNTAHVSNASGSIEDDAANWDFIVNLPTVFTALATSFDNTGTGYPATNVQDMLVSLAANLEGAFDSQFTVYDPAGTGLASTRVQSAITELKGLIDTANGLIADAFTAINTGIVQTGQMLWQPAGGSKAGYVICNATTVGDATSGASQRAHPDCEDLFTYLWNTYGNTECPVSTGRGASAAADWAAHKNIGTFDMRGTFGGLGVDTMSGAATTRLNGATVVSGSTTVAASVLGETTHTLDLASLPTGIQSVNAAQAISVSHTISGGKEYARGLTIGNWTPNVGNGGAINTPTCTGGFDGSGNVLSSTGNNSITVTSNNTGAGAHNNVPRSRTGFWYMKL